MGFSLSDFVSNPFDVSSIFGGDLQGIIDPLDLSGFQAGETRDLVAKLQALAAQEGIDFQRGQFEEVKGLFSPFVEAGAIPLAELSALITGEGEFDFTPSAGFEQGVEEGTRSLRRDAAARGVLDSSGTESRLSDLVNALTGQEIQQQIEARLQPIRTAQDAAQRIGAQAQTSAGTGSSVFSNLANQNILNAANFGQARQSSFDTASSSLAGLANLLATQ